MGNIQLGTPNGGALYLSDPSDPSKSYYMNSPQYNAVEQYNADQGMAANMNRSLKQRAQNDWQQWAIQKVGAMERGFTYHDAPSVPQLWVVNWNSSTFTPSMLQTGSPAYIADPGWNAADYTLGPDDPTTGAPMLVKKVADNHPTQGQFPVGQVAGNAGLPNLNLPGLDPNVIAAIVLAVLKALGKA